MVKFLVIRLSSIGDIVLTTPVLRGIKKQVKNAEIHFFIKKQFAPILSTNPNIDKIHILEDSLLDVIKDLKKEKFHYVIDLHKNIRSFIVRARLKAITFSVNKLNIQKWLLVNFKINRLPDVHIVDRYFETVKFFDVKNDKLGLDYFIPFGDQIKISGLPPGFKNGYIAFVIGAWHATKRLTTEKIISLCKKINLPIILLGGKKEENEGNLIRKSIGEQVLNACGKYNINQSASLVKQARLVITHDTGLMHIAAAFKKIIISVWGNTVPEFGMYPYFPDERSEIVQVEKLKCRPCSKIGFKQCPKLHFKCINNINEEQIVQSAKRFFHN